MVLHHHTVLYYRHTVHRCYEGYQRW
jgi:hypothetical protein